MTRMFAAASPEWGPARGSARGGADEDQRRDRCDAGRGADLSGPAGSGAHAAGDPQGRPGPHPEEHRPSGAGGPDAAADLEAVDIGQHNVQKRETDVGIVAEFFKSLLAGAGLNRLIAAAPEVDDDKAPDIGFVLEDKYLFHS